MDRTSESIPRSQRPTLLAIDDDPGTRAVIERAAGDAGFTLVAAGAAGDLRDRIAALRPDAALIDPGLPGGGGVEALRAVRDVSPDCHVALMVWHGDAGTAMEAVRFGAFDRLTKPLDPARLQELLATVRASRARCETLHRAASDVARQFTFCGMIGRSPAMQRLFDAIRRFAPHLRAALIVGETGTGKELVAAALHELSPRRDRRMVTINCSALVDTLFESELYGHVRGAFTGATDTKAGLFQAADGSTLFLDEVGELPLPLQTKLLRAVERGEIQRVGAPDTRSVDVQIIAATNRDLQAAAAAGTFRGDLYYRLSVIEIRLPPLRERPDDIPYLIAACINACSARLKKPILGVTAEGQRLLARHDWPGNIRELQNVIERACLTSDHQILGQHDLLAAMHRRPATCVETAVAATRADRERERCLLGTPDVDCILKTIGSVNGNKAQAARLLGMSRRALYRRLETRSAAGSSKAS